MKKLWFSGKNTNIYITTERENKQESEKNHCYWFLKEQNLFY